MDVKVRGLDDLIEKASARKIMWAPMKTALRSVGKAGSASVSSHAPRETGRLAASVTSHVNDIPAPRFVAIVVKATNQGFPYPRLLEFSAKHGHKGQLMAAVKAITGQIHSAVNAAAAQMKANWGK